MKKKYIRIILSPIVFIVYCFLAFGLWIFPSPVIVGFAIIEIFASIFYDIIDLGNEKKIERNSFAINFTDNKYLNIIIGIFHSVIIPFYGTYNYIETGELFLINE